MSGFQVLASLVPGASRPETAVVVYTSLPNPYLSELALKNGARAALRKIAPVTNLLDRSILDAISRVKKDRERLTTAVIHSVRLLIFCTASFEWMRCGRRPVPEGLPRVSSTLPRAPSQPSGVRCDTPHEVFFTAWCNDQDSDCLVDACLCRCGQHGHGTIEVQVDVKEGALQCRAVLARRPPG